MQFEHRVKGACWTVALLIFQCPVALKCASAAEPVPKVESGTIVIDEQSVRWNRSILLATPRINSGEVNKLSEPIRQSVSKLTLSLLATISRETKEGKEEFVLKEVGVGYAVKINSKLTIVTSESAPKLGAPLDFYSRQMLSENEKQIAKVALIARTNRLAIFDAPALMFRNNQHVDLVTRHLVWIDANSGKLAVMVWLISKAKEGQPVVADSTLRVVAPGTEEDRKIHVDGRSFFLGIPSSRSFALESLPPGLDLPWSEDAARLAVLDEFSSQQLSDLATALNAILSKR